MPNSKPRSKRPHKPSVTTILANWSKEVRQRDNNVCVVCGRNQYVQAHHILPKHLFKECMYEIDNGVSLCPSHHKFGAYSAHQNAIWFAEWLKRNRPQQYSTAFQRMVAHKTISN